MRCEQLSVAPRETDSQPLRVAKTVLGRGLGELLNDGKIARGNGVGALSRGHHQRFVPPAPRLSRPTLLRTSLFVADALLTGGALAFMFLHSAPDGLLTSACALAVLLGGWLGWCGLTLVDSES